MNNELKKVKPRSALELRFDKLGEPLNVRKWIAEQDAWLRESLTAILQCNAVPIGESKPIKLADRLRTHPKRLDALLFLRLAASGLEQFKTWEQLKKGDLKKGDLNKSIVERALKGLDRMQAGLATASKLFPSIDADGAAVAGIDRMRARIEVFQSMKPLQWRDSFLIDFAQALAVLGYKRTLAALLAAGVEALAIAGIDANASTLEHNDFCSGTEARRRLDRIGAGEFTFYSAPPTRPKTQRKRIMKKS